MTRRSRSLFAVLLALALLPIVSMADAGATGARVHPAMAWMQWTAKSQTALQSTHAGLGESSAHHLAATPFAAAEPFQLRLHTSLAAAVSHAPRAAAAAAPSRVHLARAPPALL